MSGEEHESMRTVKAYLLRSLVWVLIGIASFFIGASIMYPYLLVGRGGLKDHANTIREVKMWGYALFSFENDYGMYPNEKTAEMLKEKYPEEAHLLRTETSNDFLRQLVIDGYMDGSIPRFSHDRKRASDLLDSDQFPFAYVVGLKSSVNSAVPLLISPLETGKRAFDKKYARKHYHKRTVVLHIDMSVSDPKPSDGFFDWSKYDFGDLKPRIAWPKR